MLKWLDGLMDRIFAVIGAVILAQAPLFMQQYVHQLIGREAELRLQVDAIKHAANLSGKTLEELTRKFIENSDIDIARQGEVMLSMVTRWHNLSDALTAMQESSLWSRPIVFIHHLNADAFWSTLNTFKMGLPLNLEGGIYALIGIVAGYFSFAILRGIGRKIGNSCKRILRNDPKKQTS